MVVKTSTMENTKKILLGSQYLFEILEIFKNSENLVKSEYFEKLLGWRGPVAFIMKVKNNLS